MTIKRISFNDQVAIPCEAALCMRQELYHIVPHTRYGAGVSHLIHTQHSNDLFEAHCNVFQPPSLCGAESVDS